MNWRNILSAVLAAVMLILSSTAVLAETERLEETIFDLKSLGILKGDEEGNLHLEDTVTQAEFAELTRRLVQMENWTTSEERTEFSDVRMSDWYYNAVYRMYDLGVINGDGNGMFRPEAPVSTIEAAKMLIAILAMARRPSRLEAIRRVIRPPRSPAEWCAGWSLKTKLTGRTRLS